MDYSKNIISTSASIKDALSALNDVASRDSLTLFVIDESEKLVGAITDGDIRRGLLSGIPISASITEVMNKKPKFINRKTFTIDLIDELKAKELDLVPVVGAENKIEKIIDLSKKRSFLPVDAVLMAGGEGKRLWPLTTDTPKPMLKIGEVPIIERNIDRLAQFGVDNFHITIKYLGHKISDHFKDGKSKGIRIAYHTEKELQGTIGSVSSLGEFTHNEILVMNSDLLTNIDFEDFYKFFKSNNADMIVASIPYQVSLPYGVIETLEHEVKSIKEKPTYTYYSNAGIYLLKRSMVDVIPKNSFYNATDLIEEGIKRGLKVLNYPILGYWLDIGKHEDFAKAQEDIKHLKF